MWVLFLMVGEWREVRGPKSVPFGETKEVLELARRRWERRRWGWVNPMERRSGEGWGGSIGLVRGQPVMGRSWG